MSTDARFKSFTAMIDRLTNASSVCHTLSKTIRAQLIDFLRILIRRGEQDIIIYM